MLNIEDLSRVKGFRFPKSVIGYAVWAYHRFALSLRDVEDLLAERGVTVSYETIRAFTSSGQRRLPRRAPTISTRPKVPVPSAITISNKNVGDIYPTNQNKPEYTKSMAQGQRLLRMKMDRRGAVPIAPKYELGRIWYRRAVHLPQP